MASIPHPDLSQSPRVAIYARVSGEDQAERQTVQSQLDFLRRWADLHEFPIADVYVDDGWSGTVALRERPDGRRLLEDAAAGCFTVVALYRLDRLGRSIRVLLDADHDLERAGVTIRSATEPFDTSSPIGRFVFQLLASIAELERSTITERMTLGRDRAARNGKWLGVVPFGYDVDGDGALVPSTRMVPALGITEADLAREVFERIAAGASALGEAQRLAALGVPCEKRYTTGAAAPGESWRHTRVSRMVRSPIYEGRHVYGSQHGAIQQTTPALVSAELAGRARAQLTRNRTLSRHEGQRDYLLRGLMTCADCGGRFVGATKGDRGARYYRCTSQVGGTRPNLHDRCQAKLVAADDLERGIWQDCREFILNPGEALAAAQQALRERLEQSTDAEQRRRALTAQLSEKEAERDRILTLYRRNRITMDEAEAHLDRIAAEASALRRELDTLSSQTTLAAAFEARLTEASALLLRLQGQVAAIEREDNWTLKREVVEALVHDVRVTTTPGARPRARKGARVHVRYAFTEGAVLARNSAGNTSRRSRRRW